MKKALYTLAVIVGLNEISEGMFHYSVSPQQFQNVFQSKTVDQKYDEDDLWKKFKVLDTEALQEDSLKEGNLTIDDIHKLESESDYEQKAKAFEQAFFGNKILYNVFNNLLNKDPEHGKDLASLHSEFFRWLIKNHQGNYEDAKVLVALYKSLNNDSMYLLWKNVAIALNLPVERM